MENLGKKCLNNSFVFIGDWLYHEVVFHIHWNCNVSFWDPLYYTSFVFSPWNSIFIGFQHISCGHSSSHTNCSSPLTPCLALHCSPANTLASPCLASTFPYLCLPFLDAFCSTLTVPSSCLPTSPVPPHHMPIPSNLWADTHTHTHTHYNTMVPTSRL